MIRGRYRWLGAIAAACVPFLSSFMVQVLSFVRAAPLVWRPVLVLVPIFFWAVRKAGHLDFIAIMMFGFVQDFLDGSVVGLNVFIFLSAYFIAYYQKFLPLSESFPLSWLAFAVLSFVLCAAKLSIIALVSSAGAGYSGMFAGWLALVLSYPPLYAVLAWLGMKIARYS